MFERAGLGDAENLCRPRAVVVTEHLRQLRRRPDVGRALLPGGVGVQ
jgi:hypothetical protein